MKNLKQIIRSWKDCSTFSISCWLDYNINPRALICQCIRLCSESESAGTLANVDTCFGNFRMITSVLWFHSQVTPRIEDGKNSRWLESIFLGTFLDCFIFYYLVDQFINWEWETAGTVLFSYALVLSWRPETLLQPAPLNYRSCMTAVYKRTFSDASIICQVLEFNFHLPNVWRLNRFSPPVNAT